MTISYNAAAKNARLAAGLTAAVSGQSVDGGSGSGKLVLGTAGMSTVLATITLNKPSFTISAGVATLVVSPPLSATSANAGTAAAAQIQDSAGNIIISGLTVGGTAEGTGSGKDIILAASTIATGITVPVSSGTLTAS
jgi:hypothetical protein